MNEASVVFVQGIKHKTSCFVRCPENKILISGCIPALELYAGNV